MYVALLVITLFMVVWVMMLRYEPLTDYGTKVKFKNIHSEVPQIRNIDGVLTLPNTYTYKDIYRPDYIPMNFIDLLPREEREPAPNFMKDNLENERLTTQLNLYKSRARLDGFYNNNPVSKTVERYLSVNDI